jgi:hypothetical protein
LLPESNLWLESNPLQAQDLLLTSNLLQVQDL